MFKIYRADLKRKDGVTCKQTYVTSKCLIDRDDTDHFVCEDDFAKNRWWEWLFPRLRVFLFFF